MLLMWRKWIWVTALALASGAAGWGQISKPVQGLPGPAGPAGPVGPPGPAGADGAPGVPGYSPNSLLSGGGVAWIANLQFTVSAASFIVNNVRYSSAETSVTLSAADPTNPRIDVIAVDSTGVVVVIAGTPAASPAKPDVDPATQLELTWVHVAAGATAPSNTVLTDIYHENTEWTTAKSGVPINLASTSNPHAGSVDIEATAATTGNYARFTAAATFDPATRTNLVFYLRSKAAWPSTRSLQLSWYNGTARKGSIVTLNESAFGFSSSSTAAYQQIVIPVSLFAVAGVLVDRLQITVSGSGGTIGWYLDDITLQGGLYSAGASSTMAWRGTWNATASYTPNDVVIVSTAPYIALAATTNSQPSNSNANWAKIAAPNTVPFLVTYKAAVCQNATASLGFSTPATGAATAACMTGTALLYGVAQFPDGAATASVQDHFLLPADWTGSAAILDLDGIWRTAATSGSVVWQIAAVCVGDAESGDPAAFNAATTTTEAAKGVANQFNAFSIPSITIIGCTAGKQLFYKFYRDPAHASDNLAATAELVSLRFTVRRVL